MPKRIRFTADTKEEDGPRKRTAALDTMIVSYFERKFTSVTMLNKFCKENNLTTSIQDNATWMVERLNHFVELLEDSQARTQQQLQQGIPQAEVKASGVGSCRVAVNCHRLTYRG